MELDVAPAGPEISDLTDEIWLRIGLISFRQRDYKGALRAFSSLSSGRADGAWYFRGWSHLRLSQFDHARAVFEAAKHQCGRCGPAARRELDRAVDAAARNDSSGQPDGDLIIAVAQWRLPATVSLNLPATDLDLVARYYGARAHCRAHPCTDVDERRRTEPLVRLLLDRLPAEPANAAQAALLVDLHRRATVSIIAAGRDPRPQLLIAQRIAARGASLTVSPSEAARFHYFVGTLQEREAPEMALAAYARALQLAADRP